MFGFGKRKSSDPPKSDRPRRSGGDARERRSHNAAQLGFLTGMGDDGDIDNLMGNMDVGDDDLEEELAMLLDGNQPPPRRPRPSPTKRPVSHNVPPPTARKAGKNADDEDDDDDDDDLDVDDPELEDELGEILGISSGPKKNLESLMDTADDDEEDDDSGAAPPPTITGEELVKLLQERLNLYEKAIAAANSVGDSSKARRFTRGLKSLKEMIPKAKAGRAIAESDIPPPVSIGVIKKESSQPQPPSVDLSSSSQPLPTPPAVPPRPFKQSPAVSVDATIESDPPIAALPEPLIPIPAAPVTPPARPETSNFAEQAIPDVVTKPEVVTVDPVVEERLKEYKLAAVALKRQGDVQGALKYLKLSKVLEGAIKSGEPVDLSAYPRIENSTLVGSSNQEPAPVQVQEQPSQEPAAPAPPTADAPPSDAVQIPPGPGGDIFGAPPPPKTVMEALEQRLQKYKSEVEKANAASNSSKARRMGRIVKQYEEAITFYKKGKPVAFDELPTPPGFAPIPVGPVAVQSDPTPQQRPLPPQPSASADPDSSASPEKKSKDDSPQLSAAGPSKAGQSPSVPSGSISRGGKPATKLTLQEKQLQIITLRQKQFKEAALNAKKRGDVNQAREFLRVAKGFDNLIKVAQAGLPVDMATLPAPPEAVAQLELEDADNFEVVSASDCIMPSGNHAEVFTKLEDDLKQQLKMCMRTREHFKNIGDIASANRFESMAVESKKDLDALRLAVKRGGELPKYHYENRIFSITECNTDVRDDEIEISILRGINYKVANPDDVDTFVKIELPYPSAEELQTNKTNVVKDTNNPDYNATYKMTINRTARNFQRFVHRHGFKCEVWSKGGFLRGSTLIGTASVKLLPLETKCTLHDAFDILDGRKVVGKLEVRVKIREPVLTKQITQKKEKWLSIDRA